jgi:nicotinamidase-related amidase
MPKHRRAPTIDSVKPATDQLPSSKTVLLLIDFINPLDFPGAEDLAPRALSAARATARLRRAMDKKGVPTIFANDNFGHWNSEFKEQVGAIERSGGTSAQIVRALKPRRHDLTILKPQYSAFYGSPLDVLIQIMGAKNIILTGIATDKCVQLTAGDAFLRGLKIWVPPNCTAANTPEEEERALNYMKAVLRCDLSPAN